MRRLQKWNIDGGQVVQMKQHLQRLNSIGVSKTQLVAGGDSITEFNGEKVLD